MKKVILLALIVALVSGAGGYFFITNRRAAAAAAAEEEAERIAKAEAKAAKKKQLPTPDLKSGTENYPFEVYVETQLQTRERTYQDAVDYAAGYTNASVLYRKTNEVVWDNFLAFNVYYGTDEYAEFDTFGEAVAFAQDKPRVYMYYRRNNSMIWSNDDELPTAHRITGVETILQNPELPRGCEVTSLAMLLRYYNVKVTKLELADKITKDTTEYRRSGSTVYAGNPYKGFVGDMSNANNFGFGVYHGPIYELLRYYKPAAGMDLTGCYFDSLFYLIRMDKPIWIITNATYKPLPSSEFETWVTPDGEISITRKEHSVLVTGYDENYIYFNDPLAGERAASRTEFIEAWEQMGRQAVAVAE